MPGGSVPAAGAGGDGQLGADRPSGGPIDGVAVEVADLVGLLILEDFPGPAGQLAGNGGSGRDVGVTPIAHEFAVVGSQVGVVVAGNVGRLVERQAEIGRPFLGDVT